MCFTVNQGIVNGGNSDPILNSMFIFSVGKFSFCVSLTIASQMCSTFKQGFDTVIFLMFLHRVIDAYHPKIMRVLKEVLRLKFFCSLDACY